MLATINIIPNSSSEGVIIYPHSPSPILVIAKRRRINPGHQTSTPSGMPTSKPSSKAEIRVPYLVGEPPSSRTPSGMPTSNPSSKAESRVPHLVGEPPSRSPRRKPSYKRGEKPRLPAKKPSSRPGIWLRGLGASDGTASSKPTNKPSGKPSLNKAAPRSGTRDGQPSDGRAPAKITLPSRRSTGTRLPGPPSGRPNSSSGPPSSGSHHGSESLGNWSATAPISVMIPNTSLYGVNHNTVCREQRSGGFTLKFPGNPKSSLSGKPKARHANLFVPPKASHFSVTEKPIIVGNFA